MGTFLAEALDTQAVQCIPWPTTAPNSNSMMFHLTETPPSPTAHYLPDEPLRQYLKCCRPALRPHSLPVSTANIDAFPPLLRVQTVTNSAAISRIHHQSRSRTLTTIAQNQCRTGNTTEGNWALRIACRELGAPRANQWRHIRIT